MLAGRLLLSMHYMHHSFVSSVITLWNNLPGSIKLSPPLPVYSFQEAVSMPHYHIFTQ